MINQSPQLACISRITRVTDSLFVCGSIAVRGDQLRQKRITTVINVTLQDAGVFQRLQPDTKYIHIKIEDKPSADISTYFESAVERIEMTKSYHGRTLVYCGAGVSRSATICLVYLVKYGKMTLREAFYHLRSLRPIVRPNAGFWAQMIDYESKIRGRASVKMVYNSVGDSIPDVYLNFPPLPKNSSNGLCSAFSGLRLSPPRPGAGSLDEHTLNGYVSILNNPSTTMAMPTNSLTSSMPSNGVDADEKCEKTLQMSNIDRLAANYRESVAKAAAEAAAAIPGGAETSLSDPLSDRKAFRRLSSISGQYYNLPTKGRPSTATGGYGHKYQSVISTRYQPSSQRGSGSWFQQFQKPKSQPPVASSAFRSGGPSAGRNSVGNVGYNDPYQPHHLLPTRVGSAAAAIAYPDPSAPFIRSRRKYHSAVARGTVSGVGGAAVGAAGGFEGFGYGLIGFGVGNGRLCSGRRPLGGSASYMF